MQYKAAREMNVSVVKNNGRSLEDLSPQYPHGAHKCPVLQRGSHCYRPSFPRVGFRVVHCEKLSFHRTNENVIKPALVCVKTRFVSAKQHRSIFILLSFFLLLSRLKNKLAQQREYSRTDSTRSTQP